MKYCGLNISSNEERWGSRICPTFLVLLQHYTITQGAAADLSLQINDQTF